ncbi:MAG: hypothetical protein EA382_00740, partial [Spirochaetaceae bacterium]
PGVAAGADAWVAMAVDGSGRPHVVYRHSDNATLRYVYHNGTAWSSPVDVHTGDKGRYGNGIAVGSDGSVHVAYSDTTAGEMWYARAASPGAAFVRTLIDGTSSNQRFPSIALDTSNYAHITYIDANALRLRPMYARTTAGGLLLTEMQDTTVGEGKLLDSTATVITPDGLVNMVYINGAANLRVGIYLPE